MEELREEVGVSEELREEVGVSEELREEVGVSEELREETGEELVKVGWTHGNNRRGTVTGESVCIQSGEWKEKRKTPTEIGGLSEENCRDWEESGE